MSERLAVWPAEIAAHRRFLWGLARLQLGHDADADDVVQDTLVAAAQSWSSYTPATPLRAWLTGILKHKVVDALRSRQRHESRVVSWEGAEGAEGAEQSWAPGHDFTADGQWDPATFVDHLCPQRQATQGQLLELVELCLRTLPERAAQLLLMREYLGLDSAEITATANISAGNLRVILHRARLQLRRCVVNGWGEYL